MPRAELRLIACAQCGFVWNDAFDERTLAYGRDYDNSQYASPVFRQYTADLVGRLTSGRGITAARVLEIGCGNGVFLKAVVDASPGNVGYGFDASYHGPDRLSDRVTIERRFYDPSGDVKADVVICRHVIEHVAKPLTLIADARSAVDASASPAVFFETPCVEWILRNQVVWDFFYEHCSYFSAASLRRAFERSGFRVDSIDHVFGGQYLWIEATPAPVQASPSSPDPSVAELAREFGLREAAEVRKWKTRVMELATDRALTLWGAGAKGVTFANLVDPEMRFIDCVTDLNPAKQGHFLPGTGHAIVSPGELRDRNVRGALLLNPNYHQEIASLLTTLSLDIELVDLGIV